MRNAVVTPEKVEVPKQRWKQHGTRGKDKVTVIVGYGSLPRNAHMLLLFPVGPT